MTVYTSRDFILPIEDDYISRLNILEFCNDIFTENDLFLTVKLHGIKDQNKWISSKFTAIDRLVNNKRSLKFESSKKEITHVSVLVNEREDYHPHAHILIKDVDYKSAFAPDFARLVEFQFKKDRTHKDDVFIRRIREYDPAIFYSVMKQKNSSVIL